MALPRRQASPEDPFDPGNYSQRRTTSWTPASHMGNGYTLLHPLRSGWPAFRLQPADTCCRDWGEQSQAWCGQSQALKIHRTLTLMASADAISAGSASPDATAPTQVCQRSPVSTLSRLRCMACLEPAEQFVHFSQLTRTSLSFSHRPTLYTRAL